MTWSDDEHYGMTREAVKGHSDPSNECWRQRPNYKLFKTLVFHFKRKWITFYGWKKASSRKFVFGMLTRVVASQSKRNSQSTSIVCQHLLLVSWLTHAEKNIKKKIIRFRFSFGNQKWLRERKEKWKISSFSKFLTLIHIRAEPSGYFCRFHLEQHAKKFLHTRFPWVST